MFNWFTLAARAAAMLVNRLDGCDVARYYLNNVGLSYLIVSDGTKYGYALYKTKNGCLIERTIIKQIPIWKLKVEVMKLICNELQKRNNKTVSYCLENC